jgi:hypothetical protein
MRKEYTTSIRNTLGEALPPEIQRVKELRELYARDSRTRHLALRMMDAEIAEAEKANAEQDVLAMMRSYLNLKGYNA